MTNEPEPSAELSRTENPEPVLGGIFECAVCVLDRDGQIVGWNPVAETLTGYAAGEVVGKHVSVLHTPEDRDAGLPGRELAAASGGHHGSEGWRVRKNGSRFRAGVAVTPLHDRTGSLVGFACIMDELTQHREDRQPPRQPVPETD